VKSREEYEASIFAKRDALTAKRKKNIRMATATLSVVICLGAAAVAIPMLNEKPNETQALPVTDAAGGMTENKIAAENHSEHFTSPAVYDAEAYVDRHNFSYNGEFQEVTEGEECYTFAPSSEAYQIPEEEIAVEDGASEEKPNSLIDQIVDGEGFLSPDSFDDGFNVQGNKPSKKNYATEKIVAEAKKYVTDTDRIIDDKTNVTVSRNANGTTTYTAYFYTADKRITVELDSNLKLIEVKEKDNSGNGTTQIAPAYNPNA